MASPRKPPPRRPGVPSRTAASPAPQGQRPTRTAADSGTPRPAGSRPGAPSGRSAGARAESHAGGRSGSGARSAASSPARAARGSADKTGAPAAKKRPKALGPAPVLSTKQRAHLRGLGHHLAPVVQVGKEGLTDALCQAIGIALHRHELIKLRLAESVEGDRHELAAEIAKRSHAALVQVLGRTLLLFRPRPADDGEDAGAPRPHVTLH